MGDAMLWSSPLGASALGLQEMNGMNICGMNIKLIFSPILRAHAGTDDATFCHKLLFQSTHSLPDTGLQFNLPHLKRFNLGKLRG